VLNRRNKTPTIVGFAQSEPGPANRSLANGIYTISSNNALQPGQAYSQGSAGGTFGLLRQTVIRDVGLGTTRQPLNSESLHVYIYRLRAKLAEFELQIETMVNVGYRLITSKSQ